MSSGLISLKKEKEGLQLNDINKLLVYADDVVLLGYEEILRANTHTLLSNTKKLGLKVNINKTKYMVTNRYSLYNGNGQLMTNEGNFEEVAEFKYLGKIITKRNEMHKELKQEAQLLCITGTFVIPTSLKLYRTVILPVILYRCETWTLTLKEEKMLQVFENKVLRKIFVPKRDDQTGAWRRLHNGELHNLYEKPDIIRIVRSRRLRLAGHVTRMGTERGS